MEKNYLVTKSNYFIMNSSYDLSLEEQKIILTLASMVQPEDEEFKPYKFKINEFMNLLGVDTKTKYTEVPKITKELMRKVFEIEEESGLIQTAWLAGAKYKKGTGIVELIFSPYLKPYMLQLNSMFTQYKLANILNMKSKYSPRVYEILKCNEFKRQGYIEIEVDELRRLLRAENIYPLYADFKRYIIIQTQKELKKLSDIEFEFEEFKTGRKVTSIKFYIKSNIAVSKDKPRKIKPKTIEKTKIVVDNDNVKRTIHIIKTVSGKDVSARSAKAIYNNALNHDKYGEKPFELIREVAEYSKTQNINSSFIGWFKSTVIGFERPMKSSKKDNFNNFEQRQYDFGDLEAKLLGWDKEE